MIDAMRTAKFLTMTIIVVSALAAISWCCAPAAAASAQFGPQSGEAAPDRRQAWTVPSQDTATQSHALLYRPPGDGPFRLAVIAHASTESALRRAQMQVPDYPGLAAVLVAHGFAVLVPERPGHGATGRPYLEGQGGCETADYIGAGRATAAAIRAALAFMHGQPFISHAGALVIGHSAGGWGALALAADDPATVTRIVAFAPGRGGHADDRPFAVCAEARLLTAARAFGKAARVPVTWLVAQNDSYFSPPLSRRMAEAFGAGGDKVAFRVLPAFGDEGHWLAERGGPDDFDSMLRDVLSATPDKIRPQR